MRRILFQSTLALALMTLLACQAAADTTIYRVKADSTAPNPDGVSWNTAFPAIQAAIDAAVADGAGEATPAEMWVAAGTYTATTDNVVTMAEHVHLYGGFTGAETTRDARDWETNTTSIDGEETRRGVYGSSKATLDGFTITRGRNNKGGGMYNDAASPTVTNCTFSENKTKDDGGGMYNHKSSPGMKNCTFTKNKAENRGGGIFNDKSSLLITDCAFKKNLAFNGAGMYNIGASSIRVTNCTFTENRANISHGCYGGGMYNGSSSTEITDCLFRENTASYTGGGICCNSSTNPITLHFH